MNKKNFKAFLAVLLSVVMVFAIVPMTVSAADPAATISFADTANRVSQDANQQVWKQNGITVTNNKASSTSNIIDSSAPVRFYAKSEVIIAFPGMKQIEIACNSATYATACENSISDANATVSVDSEDKKIVTIVFNEAVDSFTISSLSAQVRVDAISVYTTVDSDDGEETDPKPADPAADSTLTIAEAIALGASKDHNTYTEGKYYVSGVITEVYNTQYGNMKITDGNGNVLTIYGTYNEDGTVRYDAMNVKPVAGDTVKIYGIVGQYNGTAQIKNGWIVEHTPATPATTPDPKPADPVADSTLTIAEAIALGASKD
ncbi:MAG: hypothetical protein ACI3YH_06450, partial [Eubacteriales bacterium]